MAATAQDSGLYADAGYSFVDAGETASDLGAVTFRGGYKFSKNISVEVEASYGIETSEFKIDPTLTIESQIDSAYALFGKFELPVTDKFAVNARLGVADAQLSVNEPGFDSVQVEPSTAIAYGLGASYGFTDKAYARADFSRANFEEDEASIVTISLGYRF